jgi:DNA-binding MarR family transcriptional regulator
MKSDASTIPRDAVIHEITENCLLTRTRQIARVVTALYDQELRPHGLNSKQFSLLVMILQRGPLSRAELGRENHQDRSTLTRNLQPLISQGWVAESAAAAGGRIRPLSLTAQGRRLLRTAAPAWQAAQAKARTLLGETGMRAIKAIAEELPRRSG